MNEVLNIGKAYQRKIREKQSLIDNGGLFGYPIADIKKCILKSVDYQTAKKIITKYEWLGTMGTTQFHYGIYFEGVLGGVVGFGYFQAMSINNGGHPYSPYVSEKFAIKGIQLTRGACTWWSHKHSGSKLIGFGLRQMKKKGYKYVIAFSDAEAGEIGTLYQATNWHYLGFGKAKHYDIYYTNGKIFMNDRDFYKKYKFCGKKKMQKFVEDKPYLYIKERLPKARYIKLIGNKCENKEMLKTLNKLILPYPKRKQ